MSEVLSFSPGAQVEVWLAPIVRTTAALPWQMLDESERSTLALLRRADARDSFLTGHILLRRALSRAAKNRVPPDGWRFTRSAGGRPEVAADVGIGALSFSLSRSSGLAAVAVTGAAGCEVGVDAERVDTPLACIPDDVALSPAEQWRLARDPPGERSAQFLKLWTLKEAYAKLRGRGVCMTLERIEIDCGSGRLMGTEEGDEPPADLHLITRQVRTPRGTYWISLAAQCPVGVCPEATFHLLETAWA
jgi:4'-phosphopantetheinyl transferase